MGVYGHKATKNDPFYAALNASWEKTGNPRVNENIYRVQDVMRGSLIPLLSVVSVTKRLYLFRRLS